MAKCLIVLALAITSVLAATTKTHPDFNGRIVGGSNAPDGEYPYQVSVRVNGQHNCGGSIIHNEWIVSAAHCIKGYPLRSLTIVVGSNKLNKGGTTYKVLESRHHERYNSIFIVNDIGLFKVEPITYTEKVQPIVLEEKEIKGGESCILSGWGRLKHQGEIPNDLQHIKLNTTTYELCKSRHPFPPVVESEICTFTKTGEGACSGDSGGPLVQQVDGAFKQIGVVSFGKPCGVGYPDVYARVSSYIPWIKKNCNNCF